MLTIILAFREHAVQSEFLIFIVSALRLHVYLEMLNTYRICIAVNFLLLETPITKLNSI